ncbi:hypothetical protein HPB52_007073 [Rhipicephalus sanguineus]|uniref:Uncharacterized protein n=1 Tax=Rhipicephalus sanguineus TaxID=34632 RepID=A0A9D4PYV3_RHISA|nr:hypothetical protein HPB52_007073 [Rhipicephalus sanguineus]
MTQLKQNKLAVLATVPERFLASPQGDTSAQEVSEDDFEGNANVCYGEDLAIDVAGERDSINVTHNSNEELVICKCSREDPQAPRCLWCIVLEYNDPPVNPIFRFDVTVPPGTVLII